MLKTVAQAFFCRNCGATGLKFSAQSMDIDFDGICGYVLSMSGKFRRELVLCYHATGPRGEYFENLYLSRRQIQNLSTDRRCTADEVER